ncbi:hypothetical protein J6590_010309 [Homalodisca vitripennis]|nr:hypothetical protein J6590_010309 [Homalodisca vitripennis]
MLLLKTLDLRKLTRTCSENVPKHLTQCFRPHLACRNRTKHEVRDRPEQRPLARHKSSKVFQFAAQKGGDYNTKKETRIWKSIDCIVFVTFGTQEATTLLLKHCADQTASEIQQRYSGAATILPTPQGNKTVQHRTKGLQREFTVILGKAGTLRKSGM